MELAEIVAMIQKSGKKRLPATGSGATFGFGTPQKLFKNGPKSYKNPTQAYKNRKTFGY